MPPSPGKIHTLPVRVSYTVDNSDQAYFTVLSERQKVYVHPPPGGRSASGSNTSPTRSLRSTRSNNNGHHGGNEHIEEAMALGSCVLKGVVWGVCYASPECVPTPTSYDFSVYALDPSSTSTSQTQPRPFPPANSSSVHTPASVTQQDRWDGKGFLSWALYEPADGSTLIRGRLIRSPHAFEGVSWNTDGGLEGLLAAEEQQADEEAEGEGGWGLEVELSLKRVELMGREVGDRKDFGEMIAKGREGVERPRENTPGPSGQGAGGGMVMGQSRPISLCSSEPAANVPSNGVAGKRQGGGPRRIEPQLITSEPSASGSRVPTFGSQPQNQPLVRSLAGPGPGPARATLGTTGSLPTPGDIMPRPPPHRSSLSATTASTTESGSSLPPSSVPMASNSSAQSTSALLAPNDATEVKSPRPSPPPHTRTSSGPLPRSSSTTPTRPNQPPLPSHEFTPPHPPTPTSAARSRSYRETTPPTAPTRRSPPPSTPARLQAILRSDAKLSPGLARSLANNPTLLRLLKSVPASAIPLSEMTTLKSPFGGGGGVGLGAALGERATGTGVGIDPSNPFGPPPPPPAFLKSSPATQAAKTTTASTTNKPSPAGSVTSTSTSAPVSNFNTPGSTATVTAPHKSAAKGKGKAVAGAVTTAPPMAERECYHCHTTQSTQWRSKKVKASGETLSVCDECGLYFNQHKRMRPMDGPAPALGTGVKKEGEDMTPGRKSVTASKSAAAATTTVTATATDQAQTSGSGAGVAKPVIGVGVGVGVGGGGTKRKLEVPTPGIRSSPRRIANRQVSASTTDDNTDHTSLPNLPVPPESPARKRKKTVVPSPSPRRNTRAAARESHDTPTGAVIAPSSSFSPSSFFHTSPFDRPAQTNVDGGSGGGGGGVRGGGEDVNIEALLASFDVTGGQNGDGLGDEPLDLDKWFKDAGIDMGVMDGEWDLGQQGPAAGT